MLKTRRQSLHFIILHKLVTQIITECPLDASHSGVQQHKSKRDSSSSVGVHRIENLTYGFPPAWESHPENSFVFCHSCCFALAGSWRGGGSRKTNLPGWMQQHCAGAASSLFWSETYSKYSERCLWLEAHRAPSTRLLREGCENGREVGRKRICRQPKWLSNARGNNRATAVLISSHFVYKWIKTRAVLSWSRW